jgi:histone H3/H4
MNTDFIPSATTSDFLDNNKIFWTTTRFLTCMSMSMCIMSSNPELGLASMYRVIKKSGADRVSDDAADALRKVLEEVAEKIARQAVELSLHAGRKTVKSEDVHLASKNILKL